MVRSIEAAIFKIQFGSMRRFRTLFFAFYAVILIAVPVVAAREALDGLAESGRFQEIVERSDLAIKANPRDAAVCNSSDISRLGFCMGFY